MIVVLAVFQFSGSSAQATIMTNQWNPIFKGIEHTTALRVPGDGDKLRQFVSVLRVDMQDPDIRIFATPRTTNYLQGIHETLAQQVSAFVEEKHVQVAINANLYNGPFDNSVGVDTSLRGLQISQGQLVSPADPNFYRTSVYVTTNNQIRFYPTNWPVADTNGIDTAVTGPYPLIINGVSVARNTASLIPGQQPRTTIGTTKDRRYLLLMTVDGRQPGWSDGSEDEDTAAWLLLFGAHDAVNMDGGGSSTMSMEYCPGHALRLNRPSDLLSFSASERSVGSHLAVFAKPLPGFITDIRSTAGLSAVRVQWKTPLPATTQLQYGATTNYGTVSSLDATLTIEHDMILDGFKPGETVYLKLLSQAEGQTYSNHWCATLRSDKPEPIFGFEKVWRYQTNNLDEVQWTVPSFNDSKWLGQGPGLLYYENNQNVTPRRTELPVLSLSPLRLPVTYYFRTCFTNPFTSPATSLIFSNYVDDGAVFYMNGREVQRIRMPAPPAVIQFATLATTTPDLNACLGDAIVSCPSVFTLAGAQLTNLVEGVNCLAVELHNASLGSPDAVFGMALSGREQGTVPKMTISFNPVTLKVRIEWPGGSGVFLQQNTSLGNASTWMSVPGGLTSPVEIPVAGAPRFYRLRNGL